MVSCNDKRAMFQSTPPHGRRRLYRFSTHLAMQVSIHASAREATQKKSAITRKQDVSIHASAREATNMSSTILTISWSFNPRLRTGGDQNVHLPPCLSAPVSIHASAREATAWRG